VACARFVHDPPSFLLEKEDVQLSRNAADYLFPHRRGFITVKFIPTSPEIFRTRRVGYPHIDA